MQAKPPPSYTLYHWRGHDRYGRTLKSASFAADPISLTHTLQQHEQITLTKAWRAQKHGQHRRIQQAALAITEQLAQLLHAHVALPQALKLLQYSLPQAHCQAASRHLSMRIEQGLPLHQAMAECPAMFQAMYRHIIAISEKSAQLVTGLRCLHQYLSQKTQFKQQLRDALSYPSILAMAALSTLCFLLYWVMPHFAELFQNMHAALPASTRYVLAIAGKVNAHPKLCLLGTVSCLATGYQALRHTPWTLRYRLPILGHIWQLIERTQALHLLAMIAQAKIPWPVGIGLISKQATSHQQAWQQTQQALLQGKALHVALAHHPAFHHTLCAQLATAEHSGQLAMTLDHLAQQNVRSAQNALQGLKQRLEPLFTLGMGCMIAAMMVILYLPLLQLGDALWSTSMGS